MFLLALGFGFGPTFAKAGGGNYLQFLAPGVISMGILFSAVFSGIEIIWDRQFGFLKETLVAPVPRLTIVLGRVLGGATVAMIQGTVVFIVCLVAGFRFENAALLPVAWAFMFLIALLFTSIGTTFGSVMQDMQGFQLVMNFFRAAVIFSRALFFQWRDYRSAAGSDFPEPTFLRRGWTSGSAYECRFRQPSQ